MEIPDYGDHMSLDQFIQAVDQMAFIDYDGFGKLATDDDMSNILIRPSDVFTKKEKTFKKKFLKITEGYTHIVWFNR